MKQRSTTPVSKSFVAKASLVAAAVLMAVSGPVQMGSVARADEFDDRINAIQRQVNGYQQEAARLQAEAQTLKGTLDQLNVQKSGIQAQIDLNQAKYEKLQQQIIDTEKKIKDNQDALGETLANLYVDDDISPLEMIASSKNISEYLDKQEYRNSIRDTLSERIGEIKQLKIDLDKQKSDVEEILVDQRQKRDELAAKESAQSQLLAQTQGNESAYQNMISDSNDRIKDLKRQQDAQRAASRGWGGGFVSVGGTGGYPYICGDYPCWRAGYADPWGLYYQECVSYVAWKLDSKGYGVSHFRGAGNATQWPDTAGYAYWRYGSPKPGDAMVRRASSSWDPGHVSYVENVSSDGTILVSEYNFNVDGEYTERRLTPSQYSGLMFGTFPPAR